MRTRDLKAAARAAGKAAGISAASWVEVSETNASAILAGLNDCDPAVYDSLAFPNLSGEYADAPTPRSLMEDIGLGEDDTRYEWLESDLCDAWENASSQAFEREVSRRCRYHLST